MAAKQGMMNAQTVSIQRKSTSSDSSAPLSQHEMALILKFLNLMQGMHKVSMHEIKFCSKVYNFRRKRIKGRSFSLGRTWFRIWWIGR